MSRFDTTGSGHLSVGSPRIHLNDDDPCPHTGINVCRKCAELTDDETAALREYFAFLAAAVQAQEER